jgi:hypothetical protein
MKTKDKYLFLLVIDFILYSILIASFHPYTDLKASHECSICKFAADIASGIEAAFYTIIVPYFVCVSLISESLILLRRVSSVVRNTRAPPVFIYFPRGIHAYASDI